MRIKERDKVDEALIEAGESIGMVAGRVVAKVSAVKETLTGSESPRRTVTGNSTKRRKKTHRLTKAGRRSRRRNRSGKKTHSSRRHS